jgi:hypothetical protein
VTCRQRLRTIACCGILQLGTLLGMPMRPEQVQDLMHTLNQPKLAQTDPDEKANGDDSPQSGGRSEGDQQPQA